MTPPTPDDLHALEILQRAVTEALERKRKLGQYAVIWQDGRVVRIEPDAPPPSPEVVPAR